MKPKDPRQNIIQRTISNVFNAAQQRFSNFNQPVRAQGIGKPVTIQPLRQMGRGFVESSAYGLYKPPGQNPNTFGQKLGYGVGFAAGMFNPLNPINKLGILAKVGNVGAKAAQPLVKKLAPMAVKPVSNFIVNKALPNIGSEVAQTAAMTTASNIAGQAGLRDQYDLTPQNFATSLLYGLGARAGLGALGKSMGKPVAKGTAQKGKFEVVIMRDGKMKTHSTHGSLAMAKRSAEMITKDNTGGYISIRDVTPEGYSMGIVGKQKPSIPSKAGRKTYYHGRSTEGHRELKAGNGNLGKGVYLTKDLDEARNYAAGWRGGVDPGEYTAVTPGRIYKVEVLTDKIYKSSHIDASPEFIESLKKKGYEGLETPNETIIFDPKKTKITGNPTLEEFRKTNPYTPKSFTQPPQSSVPSEVEGRLKGLSFKNFEDGIYAAANGSENKFYEDIYYNIIRNPKNASKSTKQIYDELINGRIQEPSPVVQPKLEVKRGKVQVKMEPVEAPISDTERLKKVMYTTDPYEAGVKKRPQPKKDAFIEGLEKDQVKFAKAQPILSRGGAGDGGGKPPKDIPAYTGAQADEVAGKAQFMADENKKAFDTLFAKWIGNRDVAKTTGVQKGMQFRNIKAKAGPEVIKYIENPQGKAPKHIRAQADRIRQEYDSLFVHAKQSGIDMRYLKNYITHIWDKPMEEVAQIYKTAKQQFGFSKERSLPTYEEGIKLGLKPKYDQPSQILSEYARKLEETKANIQFFEQLKKEGLIVHGSVGAGRPGFEALTGPGFPRSVSKNKAGEVFYGNYYAPKKIADQINRIFTPQDYGAIGTVTSGANKASGIIQDITLSGGIPKSPANAWTFAQMTKEILSGRIKSPLASFMRSLSGKHSNTFFEKNVDQIKKMQSRNIPIETSMNVDNLPDRGTLRNMFGNNAGDVWSKTMNEPTFKRFMPQLQINLFNDIERQALKAGRSADEATDIAAKAVKNFYGITDSATLAKRSQLTKDSLGAILFAPRYRESMINFWGNIVKGLANPLALENRANLKFAIGATLALTAMNYLNEKYNGHGMMDNPKSHRDKLLIPLGDGYTIGIPFLSSIATMPRFAIKQVANIASLDGKEFMKENKTLLSSLVRPPLDVITNENYFGQEIYDPAKGAGNSLKDIGGYLAGQYAHPYMRAAAEAGVVPGIKKKDQPGYATASKALELPIRFYKDKSIQNSYYYDSVDEYKKKLDTDKQKVYTRIYETDEKSLDVASKLRKDMSDANDLLANPDVLNARRQIEMDAAKKQKVPVNPMWQLSSQQLNTVLVMKTLPPGDPQKSALTTENIDWLKPYWQKNEQYYNTLTAKGIYAKEDQDSKLYMMTPDIIRKKQDFYFTLPSGTGQRTAFINANPDLAAFWDEKREFTNHQRALLGLPPLEDKFGGGFGKKKFAKKPKKVRMKKVKLFKAKNSKSKVKVPKTKKVKLLARPKSKKKLKTKFI